MPLKTEKYKKFLKLVSINGKYLLNKQTIIMLFFSLIIIVISLLINTNFYTSKASKILYSQKYYEDYLINSYNIIIVILAFFSIFISLVYASNYDVYLITRRPRHEVIIAKLLCCTIILMIYVYIVMCLFIILPIFFMKYFIITKEIFMSFGLLLLNGLFLMLLSILLYELSKNILSSFVVLVIYWVMKIFSTPKMKKGSFIYFLNQIYPTLMVEEEEVKKTIFANNWIVFPLCSILAAIIIVYYCKKRIK